MSSLDPFRMIGKTLAGHFLVQSLVGEGRSSIVYKGLHIGPKKPVALKCYKLGAWLDAARAETFLRRFREESKAASQIAKELPQFARSIGSGMTTSDDGVYIPYTVLEWLEGHSLAHEVGERSLRGESGRPLTELLVRFEAAAKALAQAHEQKLVHGDINLGSFFLVKSSGGESPSKVLDLGVAKVMRDLGREIAPGEAPELIASPTHAAPEQFDPKLGEWGPPTDVYALALVLIEAMRGRVIPRAGEEKDFAASALDPKKRPTPRVLGLSVFDAVENAFAKALAVAPSERWSNVGEFWAELENAVRSEEPTRRVLPTEVHAEDEESEEVQVPSTEPRPGVSSVGEKPATDDTSPNGVLIDATGLAPVIPPAVAPPPVVPPSAANAAPAPDRVSALPVPAPTTAGATTAVVAKPVVPSQAPPAGSVPAPARSSPALKSVSPASPAGAAASGSGGLFKIPPPTPAPKKLQPDVQRITPPPPQGLPLVSGASVASSGGAPSGADVAATGRASQPHGIPRPLPGTARTFPSTPAKPRSDLPPPKVSVTAPPVLSPAAVRGKPELEVRRDTPTMPIEAVAPQEAPPRLTPLPKLEALETKPALANTAAEPKVVENGTDGARVVREMMPPPKANVTVGDLPSVMVDEPDQRKEKESRQRETVRIAMPTATPAVAWDAANANNIVAPAKEDSDSVVYPPRTVRRRRGLWGVALVSFIVVFLLGAIFIALWHYSTELP